MTISAIVSFYLSLLRPLLTPPETQKPIYLDMDELKLKLRLFHELHAFKNTFAQLKSPNYNLFVICHLCLYLP